MTDKQLEYIVEIAVQGNVTRAAQALFVGQSALSQVLAHVEKELGIQIFLRTPTALVPTPAGEMFLNSARKVLQIKQNTLNQLNEQKGICLQKIRVGMSQSRSWLFTPVILPEFLQHHPNVNVELVEGTEAELNHLLTNGKIDVMFTIFPYTNNNFVYQPLFKENIVLVLSKDHPIANNLSEPVEWSKLKDVPFILLCAGNNLRTISDQIMASNQLNSRILLESRSMDVCFQMAVSGLGATLIPDTLSKGHRYKDRAVVFQTGEQYSREIAIVTRKESYLPETIREFIRVASEKLEEVYQ